jgi:hypothetical protein
MLRRDGRQKKFFISHLTFIMVIQLRSATERYCLRPTRGEMFIERARQSFFSLQWSETNGTVALGS